MKKLLLLSIAALTISSAHAQFNLSTVDPASRIAPPVEMKLDAPTPTEKKAPQKAKSYYAYYNRPAGAFVGNTLMQNGSLYGTIQTPMMVVKPNSEYTFNAVKNNMDDSWWLSWDYFDQNTQQWSSLERSDYFTINTGYRESDMPYLSVFNQNDEYLSYYQLGSTDDYTGDFYGGMMVPYDFEQAYGYDLLLSSKTMVPGGRFGDLSSSYMRMMTGATPYGNNDYGWWLGKNGQGVDGIAQAFEKPEHPYILKQVVLEATYITITDDVEMTCKVYKLANGIPAYKDDGCVELTAEPGELIATGRATITSGSGYGNSLIVFSLYGNNGKEITPTIKDAIFVAIDGYNDPEMENLADFTAMYSTDNSDEGFGELAYVKNIVDGEYVWSGLNNFFGSGTQTMKTGLSIYITTKFSEEDLEQTDAPSIDYQVSDQDVTITATGEGEVLLYIDGEPVDNPCVIMRGDQDKTVIATATAQNEGELISETASVEITIPALPALEQTGAPVFNGIGGEQSFSVEIIPTEPSDIYYRVGVPNEDGEYEYNEWAEYQDILTFTEAGNYRIEAYALANGKTQSEIIAYEFVVTPVIPVTPDLPGYIIIGTPATNGEFYVNYMPGDYDGDYEMVVTINGEVVEANENGTYQAVEGENNVVVTVKADGYNDKVGTNTFNFHYATTAPVPTFIWNAETFTMEAVCEGHTVVLYANGTEVENPYTVEQTDVEQIIVFSAYTVAADEDNNSAVVYYAENPVIIPAKPVVVTPPAAPTYEVTYDDDFMYITFTCEEDAELTIYDENGQEVAENPIVIARPEYDEAADPVYVHYSAKATKDGVDSETVYVNEKVNQKAKPEPVYTDKPVITLSEIELAYVVIHVDGNGKVTVWVNGDEVELDEDGNIMLHADTDEDITYVITAIAQEEGKLASETAEFIWTVPAYNDDVNVSEVLSGKTVSSVRYFNMMGQEMPQPDGFCIVVTTFTDGTATAVKVMK